DRRHCGPAAVRRDRLPGRRLLISGGRPAARCRSGGIRQGRYVSQGAGWSSHQPAPPHGPVRGGSVAEPPSVSDTDRGRAGFFERSRVGPQPLGLLLADLGGQLLVDLLPAEPLQHLAAAFVVGSTAEASVVSYVSTYL